VFKVVIKTQGDHLECPLKTTCVKILDPPILYPKIQIKGNKKKYE